MIIQYFEQTDYVPDKVVKCKVVTDSGKVEHKFPLVKKLPEGGICFGYISNKHQVVGEESIFCTASNPDVKLGVLNKKKPFHKIVGYARVGRSDYIALTMSKLPALIIATIVVMFLGICGIGMFKMPKVLPKPELDISDNAVDINVTTNVQEEVESEMVYISGQSITKVTEKNPNVYLCNDAVNTGYYLKYEVYLEGVEQAVYTTELIPSGKAEPWNTYENEYVKDGTNMMVFKVFIYDLEGELVATTNVDGMKLIK